jgi:hypothetical protein
MSTTKARVAPKTPAANDAIKQLKANHAEVSGLFAAYEKTRSVDLLELGSRMAARKAKLLAMRG